MEGGARQDRKCCAAASLIGRKRQEREPPMIRKQIKCRHHSLSSASLLLFYSPAQNSLSLFYKPASKNVVGLETPVNSDPNSSGKNLRFGMGGLNSALVYRLYMSILGCAP